MSPAGGYAGELDAVAVAEFQQSAMAENTGVAYRSDWRQFTRWAGLRDLPALPASPETVAAYLASMARLTDETGGWLYAPSTLGRRLAAIAKGPTSSPGWRLRAGTRKCPWVWTENGPSPGDVPPGEGPSSILCVSRRRLRRSLRRTSAWST